MVVYRGECICNFGETVFRLVCRSNSGMGENDLHFAALYYRISQVARESKQGCQSGDRRICLLVLSM